MLNLIISAVLTGICFLTGIINFYLLTKHKAEIKYVAGLVGFCLICASISEFATLYKVQIIPPFAVVICLVLNYLTFYIIEHKEK